MQQLCMQAMVAMEGLLHPRAAPLQLRPGTVAGAKPDDAPLTLGQPRFWSADTSYTLISNAPEDGTEHEATNQGDAAYSGSAEDGSITAAPPAVPQEHWQGLADADGTQDDKQPDPSLAALDCVGANVYTNRLPVPAVEVRTGQDIGPAPCGGEAVRSTDPVDPAASDEDRLALPQLPSDVAESAPTMAAVKAPQAAAIVVPSTFQDTVESDSEGPMPSIDSGPSDSESDE